MRIAIALLALLMSSCVGGPGILRTSSGNFYAHTGFAFIASRKEVIAKVTTREGDTIEYMAKKENADSVVQTAAAGYAAGLISGDNASVAIAKESTSKHAATQGATVELGKQSVEKAAINKASDVPTFLPR